ncbi:MAG: DNA internalization-related competence protein ComEC/Rec2 [Defluviitaleaceae bacterium]|nr:DNA internalization-related competence protein ComEC/Rec2 [Defluviitaleaceae bacterium]
MARPVVWIFMFLAGGILFGRHFDGLGLLPFFVAFACLVSVGMFCIYRRKIAFTLPAFAVLGFILIGNALAPNCEIMEQTAQREGFVRIEGVVQDVSNTRSGRYRVSVQTNWFSIAPAHKVNRATVGIQAVLPDGIDATLGQRVVLTGYLSTLDTARNPGGFDEFQFLRSRGIEYRLFVEDARTYEIAMTPIMHIRNFGLRLSNVFSEVLPEEQAGIMSAMVVGDRSGLDGDVRNLYSSVGMFHILVVSGLHVNILSIIFGKMLEKLGVKSQRSRGLATIGFIIVFAILTGAGVATLRASIMGIMLILTSLAGFENDTPTSLSIAAIALLIHQPLFLFDLGFIYSFTMVLALVVLTPPIEKLLYIIKNKAIRRFVAFNISATAVYTLINTHFFFEFSPYALLANLLIMPTVAITLGFGMLTAITGLFSIFLAQIFAFPIWVLLSLYQFIMEAILHFPFAVVLTGRPHPITLTTLTATLIAFILIANKGKQITKRLTIVSATALTIILVLSIVQATRNQINVTFLDVGQGKSSVISRNGQAVVIDGGGVFGREAGENTGTFTLTPYLNFRGISQTTAIVTHNHRDHIMGIIEATEAGRVSHIIMAYANSEPNNPLYAQLLEIATHTNTRVTYVSAGDMIDFHGMHLYIIFPNAQQTFLSENNSSIVIRAVYGDHAIILPADLEHEAETYLATNHSQNLPAQILQIAHHGSRTSTTEEFLQAVNPQVAIISAGRNNMFGHPHQSVTDRLNHHGVTHFNTATHGAILIRTNGTRMTVNTMLTP